MAKINVGESVCLRKPHPCGGTSWRVLRAGTEVRLKCERCGGFVTMGRARLDQRLSVAAGKDDVRGRPR